MLFSELYSTYYHTVAKIIQAAVHHSLSSEEILTIVEQNAFGESMLSIPTALQTEQWQLIRSDGSTPIQKSPTMPLTTIQKRWLKALGNDPRMKLFTDNPFDFPDVEPLFFPEDIEIFDQYADGDNYTDEMYIRHFRLILDAVEHQYPLTIQMYNRKGQLQTILTMPKNLEYSEKDDKFRLIGSGSTINLGRIVSCKKYSENSGQLPHQRNFARPRTVIFELLDERNTLERVMLHFAHYEKQAERLGNKKYRLTVRYDKEDETELVIRILSFGPLVRVTAPEHFINLIKNRLIQQKSCEQ